jgi:hypothetical protein
MHGDRTHFVYLKQLRNPGRTHAGGTRALPDRHPGLLSRRKSPDPCALGVGQPRHGTAESGAHLWRPTDTLLQGFRGFHARKDSCFSFSCTANCTPTPDSLRVCYSHPFPSGASYPVLVTTQEFCRRFSVLQKQEVACVRNRGQNLARFLEALICEQITHDNWSGDGRPALWQYAATNTTGTTGKSRGSCTGAHHGRILPCSNAAHGCAGGHGQRNAKTTYVCRTQKNNTVHALA